MTDEPNGHTADDDNRLPAAWSMPEPVFRSSEGVTPKNRRADDAADKPIEISDLQTLEREGFDPLAEPSEEQMDPPAEPNDEQAAPTPDRLKVIAAQPKTKKGGCAMSVMAILLIVVAGLAALIIVLGYLYYSTPAPDPFNN
jgi:hypothetical protein